MPTVAFKSVLTLAVISSLMVEASVCPAYGQHNYGQDHCEVIAFVPQELGSDTMTGTVWVNRGDCNTKFFNASIVEIAAVWPEADIIKKNGPRVWMTSCSGFDSMEAAQARMSMPVRKLPPRTFLGTQYFAQAQLTMPRTAAEIWGKDGEVDRPGQYSGQQGSPVNRSTVFAWEAGARVYELVSPAGWPYIMQSMSMQIDTNLQPNNLVTLADRLTKLPKGWRYRSRVLSSGVAVRGHDGMVVQVLQDQFQNTYSRHDTYLGVAWWDADNATSENESTPALTSSAPSSSSPAGSDLKIPGSDDNASSSSSSYSALSVGPASSVCVIAFLCIVLCLEPTCDHI